MANALAGMLRQWSYPGAGLPQHSMHLAAPVPRHRPTVQAPTPPPHPGFTSFMDHQGLIAYGSGNIGSHAHQRG